MVARTMTRVPAAKRGAGAQVAKANMKGHEEATAKAKGAARSKAADKANGNTQAYITTLKEAGGFHKRAFYIEMGVCLAFYAEHKKVDNDGEDVKVELSVKKLLRPIYEKAGFDCKTPKGEDYKTVMRRIQAAADLYAHLGGSETIDTWGDGAKPVDAIHHIADALEKDGFESLDAVRRATGKLHTRKPRATVTATTTAAPAGPDAADKALMAEMGKQAAGAPPAVEAGKARLEDTLPPERVLRTTHLVLAIPLDTTKEELTIMATNILAFVGTMQAAPVAAPVTTG